MMIDVDSIPMNWLILKCIRQVDLDPNSTTPWRNVFSIDHAGDQKWAQGEKVNSSNHFINSYI
jgi:hypothetical protein